MTDSAVETITIKGLRYVVATLRPGDIHYLAKMIAVELNRISDERDAELLENDHARGPLHDGTHEDCIVCHPVIA